MKTSEIVQQSIDKWEAIVAGTGADNKCVNCSLCKRFLTDEGSCTDCPIKKFTYKSGCKGTPYDAWLAELSKEGKGKLLSWPRYATTPKLRELAQAEVDFLKHILELQLEKENENN